MKKTKLLTVGMGLAAMLVFSACGKKEEAVPERAIPAEAAAEEKIAETGEAGKIVKPAAKKGGAAKESEAEKESETAKETEAKEVKAAEAIGFTCDVYERDYPNAEDEEGRMYIASAERFTLTTDKYPLLQDTLDMYNDSVTAEADRLFTEMAGTFAFSEPDAREHEMMPYSDHIFVTADRADSALFSFTETSENWQGGTHPYSFRQGITIDPESGAILALKDICEDYDGVYELVHSMMEESEAYEAFFPEWEDTLKTAFYAENPEVRWSASNHIVNVWFNQYEIAPYSAGPVWVELDLRDTDTAKLFKMEYFPENSPEAQGPVQDWGGLRVNELCHYEDEYRDGVDNTFYYEYRLPEIDSENPYAKTVNAEIVEIMKEQIQPELDGMKEGNSLGVISCNYTVGRIKGITSIYLELDTDWDDNILYSWNFHSDGSEASNEEIFEAFGLTAAEFTEKVKELHEETAYGKESEDPELRRLYQMSMDSCHADMPVYINQYHELCCIADNYFMAGSGHGYVCYAIPGTQKRADGRTLVLINLQSKDNVRKDGNKFCLKDVEGDQEYVLDNDTILIFDVPCYEPEMDPMHWMVEYLRRDGDGSGFAMGDVFSLLVNDEGHIDVLQGIHYWD